MGAGMPGQAGRARKREAERKDCGAGTKGSAASAGCMGYISQAAAAVAAANAALKQLPKELA